MARRTKLAVGDVFRLIPYGDGRHGFGQILAPYGRSGGHFYFGVFGTEHVDPEPSLDVVAQGGFALLALSMDALLYRGYWPVVGTAPTAQDIRWPHYKIARAPERYVVEDAAGNVLREANAEDVESLPFRTVVAPVRLQHAFEALHGVRPWLVEYDELRYSNVSKSREHRGVLTGQTSRQVSRRDVASPLRPTLARPDRRGAGDRGQAVQRTPSGPSERA